MAAPREDQARFGDEGLALTADRAEHGRRAAVLNGLEPKRLDVKNGLQSLGGDDSLEAVAAGVEGRVDERTRQLVDAHLLGAANASQQPALWVASELLAGLGDRLAPAGALLDQRLRAQKQRGAVEVVRLTAARRRAGRGRRASLACRSGRRRTVPHGLER